MARLTKWLILAAFLSGCGGIQTTYELEQAVKNSTGKTRARLQKRLDERYQDAEEAVEYYEMMAICPRQTELMVACRDGGFMGPHENMDVQIRNYRRDKWNCVCTYRDQAMGIIR